MNKKSRLHYLGSPVLLLILILVFPLFSPDGASAQELNGGILRSATAQGYRFMSGGVGTAERDEMMQQVNLYNLVLSFAARSGQYLSDVSVVISDERGNEIINTTAGPLLFAELPAGRYNVRATYEGHREEIKGLEIHNGGRVSRLFHWNVPDDALTQK